MKRYYLLSCLLCLCLVTSALAQDAFTLAKEGSFYDVVLALSSGADFGVADAYGQTPLMYAASSNAPDVVNLLVDHGVEVNARSLAGWTPLMYAARDASNPEVILVLLGGGADPALRNEEGQSALDYASANTALTGTAALAQLSDPARAALTPSTPVEAPSADRLSLPPTLTPSPPSTPTNEVGTREPSLSPTETENVSFTDLFTLVKEGGREQVGAVLQAGIDVNAADAYGQTLLMYAAGNEDPEVVSLLVEAGAALDVTSLAGWTALMYAVRDNPNPEVVLRLFELGADPSVRNEDDLRAVDYVAQNLALLGTSAYDQLQASTMTEPQPEPTYEPPQQVRSCCKICSKGKACGNSCISRSYTCHKGVGCACDASDLDPELLRYVSLERFDGVEEEVYNLGAIVAATIPCEIAELVTETF